MVAEVPRWIGQDLFGWLDPPTTQTHPVVLYDMVSELCQEGHHPAVTASLVANRARQLRSTGRRLVVEGSGGVRPAGSVRAGHGRGSRRAVHSAHPPSVAAPSTATPHRTARARPRGMPGRRVARSPEPGGTVIGVHVRRGDFDVKFSHQGFEFVAPMHWYRSWLEELWPRSERPVLFVASDSPAPGAAGVVPVSSDHDPRSARGVSPAFQNLGLPPTHLQRDAGFFLDWGLLTRCHALAISNSTFSFTASMVNASASVFARPDPQARSLVPFDPWDSEPLLFLRSGEPVGRSPPPARDGAAGDWSARYAAEPSPGGALVRRDPVGAGDRGEALRGDLRPAPELLRPQFYLSARRRYDEDRREAGEASRPPVRGR